MAFLIAAIGIALSWQFLRPEEWAQSDKNRQVVAYVLDLKNDVNRQEEGRLLWSPIRKGDEIFLGDKLKTSGLSSVVLQFIESTSKLEIEENSMIVMSQGGKKLALNMLEGRVFIKQDESSGDQSLDLLSGGKKLDLKGDASISISKDGGSQIESFSQSGNIFTELRPDYSKDILSLKNLVTLSWKPLERDEEIEIWIGESPLLLKKSEGTKSKFSEGRIDVAMKPGLNYWQLVSVVDGAEVKSPLMKLSLIRPLPPSPLYPSDKEVIKIGEKPFDFKWIKGNGNDTVKIEIAKDQNFSQVLTSKDIKDQTFFTPDVGLTEGEYYWRLKSQISGSDWIESKAFSFSVYLGSSFLSPVPILPNDQAVIYLTRSAPRPVNFEWRKVTNAVGYELRISGDNFSRDLEASGTTAAVNINRTGQFSWEVAAIGKDGVKSILPMKRKFEVRELENIAWSMPQKTFLYLDSLPIIILKWEKRNSRVSVLKIASTPDMANAETFQVQGRDFPYRVMKDGSYFAKVVTLDESGETAAISDVLEFKVQEAPLPPSPILVSKNKKLRASPQGDVRTQLENSKSNWLTIATLLDVSGRVVDERRFSESNLEFSGLMPGKYILQMKFQDEYRRMGENSERIELEVPEKSVITAPKLKGIKVR